ncbi:MAG: T9SS type A sorting domain-containing protein [Bacteroidales bacterium]
MKIRFLILMSSIMLMENCYTQTLCRWTAVSAGSSYDTAGYNISFSIGQPAVSTFETDENILTQGFQQPSLVEIPPLEDAIVVRPNPVIRFAELVIDVGNVTEFHAELYSLAGNKIMVWHLRNLEVNTVEIIPIDLHKVAAGIYILHVFSNYNVINHHFKIEKL